MVGVSTEISWSKANSPERRMGGKRRKFKSYWRTPLSMSEICWRSGVPIEGEQEAEGRETSGANGIDKDGKIYYPLCHEYLPERGRRNVCSSSDGRETVQGPRG